MQASSIFSLIITTVTIILTAFAFSSTQAAPIANHPALSLQPGHWWRAPNTSFIGAKISPNPANYTGLTIDESALFRDTGAALDTRRNLMFVTGGNRNTNDNSVYVFDINTLAWSRRWGPGGERVPSNTTLLELWDSSINTTVPAARATKDGIEYVPIDDQFITMGGEYTNSGGVTSNHTWAFNIVNNNWTRLMDWDTFASKGLYQPFTTMYGTITAWDPFSQTVVGSGQFLFITYDAVSKNITSTIIDYCAVAGYGGIWNAYATGEVLADKRTFVIVGGGFQYRYNISTAGKPCLIQMSNYTAVAGSPGLLATLGPGVAYHPGLNTLVGYAGAGAEIYVLNTTTWTWKLWPASRTNTIIPTVTRGGFYSRWRYVPDYDAFVFISAHNNDVYFYKLGVAPDPTECDAALLPSSPPAYSWDCVYGTWKYTATLEVQVGTKIVVSGPVLVQGDVNLAGKIETSENGVVNATGCINLALGSGVRVSQDLTLDEAKSLLNTTRVVIQSSTACLKDTQNLDNETQIIARLDSCNAIAARANADQARGQLQVVFSVQEDCSGLLIPVWAVVTITLGAAALVVAIFAILWFAGLRNKILPYYRAKVGLRDLRKSMQPES